MDSKDSLIERASAWWTPAQRLKVLGKRTLILDPVLAAPLLSALSLMNKDGSISPEKLRKFLQLNHMLQLLAPKLLWVAKQNQVVRLMDACCGTSFLGLTIAWYFKNQLQHPVEILGIDRNPSLINTSNNRAIALDLAQEIRFSVASLATDSWRTFYAEAFAKPASKLNVLLALHACDTATDLALALGMYENVNLVAVAPCCQAELNRFWEQNPLPVSNGLHSLMLHPQIRRETAAQFTDLQRSLVVQAKGYEVTATEFVESSHTPKNRLIIAEKRGNYWLPGRENFLKLWTELGRPSFTLLDLLQSANLWEEPGP